MADQATWSAIRLCADELRRVATAAVAPTKATDDIDSALPRAQRAAVKAASLPMRLVQATNTDFVQRGDTMKNVVRVVALAVASAAVALTPAYAGPQNPPSAPVTVVNTTANPVPVIQQGTTSISGSVTVNNTSGNPVPVTGSVAVAGAVSITGTPNVNITGGSVNVGTKIIASFEADDLDSSQHIFGPFDISPYSKIRFSVIANGTGSVVADIETDGLGDFFQVDAGDRNTRLYEVAGTKATIILNGDSHITQVFVRLFGS
jgi:hypothetical protein